MLSLKRVMNTKTVVMAAAIIAATASLAMVPTFMGTAMAAKGGDNPGDTTTTTCVHNGNGRTTDGECSNPSGNTETTTCDKIRGQFYCTTTTTG